MVECVFVAALDSGEMEVGKSIMKKMASYYPPAKSVRMKKNMALLYEAEGDFVGAKHVYETIVSVDPTDLDARKRLAFLPLTSGDKMLSPSPQAKAEALCQLLKDFPGDTECWVEAGDLYLSTGNLPEAVYCAQELVVLQPQNAVAHLRLAEVLLASGEAKPASDYFSEAALLNPELPRAWMGLMVASFSAHSAARGSEKAQAVELNALARQNLARLYKGTPSEATIALTVKNFVLL